jgi:NADH dehydrogenase
MTNHLSQENLVPEFADAEPHVVIVGAGFGGLWAARILADKPLRVTLYDRHNYHTFQPLLYQVAAAEIEAEQIGYPVRGILRHMKNVQFALANITAVNPHHNSITTSEAEISYDYLILATGSVTQFFGTPGAAEHAFSLKSMEEAVYLRNHILSCFEEAAHSQDEALRRQLLTFVVVGAGPTGVEYAGALSELIYGPLKKDFPEIDMDLVSIVLVEAADRVLNTMPAESSEYAIKQLTKMGVTVRLNLPVTAVSATDLSFEDGSTQQTNTVVWVAGVGGESLPAESGIEVLRNGRVPVQPSLNLDNYHNIYVIGDLAAFRDEEDELLPMVAQVAMQQGDWAARNILRQINDQPLAPFKYRDKGTMATIGRNRAVVDLNGRVFNGIFAWFIWLFVHIFYLIGFRNRVMVMLTWAIRYLTFEQMVRLILPSKSVTKESILQLENKDTFLGG